jgi:hypothetical protein
VSNDSFIAQRLTKDVIARSKYSSNIILIK